MLANQTLSDLVSQRPRSVIINYEQVYRKMNDVCISITFFTRVNSECSRFNGYCV